MGVKPLLTCSYGEPWGLHMPHPLCDAALARDCAEFDRLVAEGMFDAQGYTPNERKAQQRRQSPGTPIASTLPRRQSMATLRTATTGLRAIPQTLVTATATTTETVKIRPDVRRKLLTELRAWQEINEQYNVLKHAREKHTASIRALRESTGASSIEIDGFKIKDVTGTTSKLNTEILKERYDVTQAMIDDATETKPKKAYERITAPGGKEEEY